MTLRQCLHFLNCGRSTWYVISLTLVLILVAFIIAPHFTDGPQSIVAELEAMKGIVAASADLDGDYLDDLFIIDSQPSTFSIFKGSNNASAFLTCHLNHKEKIVSLVPGDFDGNSTATVDLLIIAKEAESDEFKIHLLLDLNLGKCKFITSNFTIQSQPLVADFNGDQIPDLLAIFKGKRALFTFDNKNKQFKQMPPKFQNGKQFRKPAYSHAFVDLNGDTIPDVFIDGEDEMEYWYLGEEGFHSDTPNLTFARPKDAVIIGQSSFIDYNLNEKIDHLLPVCYDQECNNSTILVYREESKNWVSVVSGPQFKFHYSPNALEDFSIHLPITLRHVDYNLDELIDFVVLTEHNGSVNISILDGTLDSNGYSFQLNTEESVQLNDSTAIIAAPIDLQNNGLARIIVTTLDRDKKLDTQVIKNPKELYEGKEKYDPFFIKFFVGSAIQVDDNNYWALYINTNPFRQNSLDVKCTNQPGVHLCYKKMLQDFGDERRSCSAQLTQSTFLPLQMPYTIFGVNNRDLTPFEKLTASFSSPNTTGLHKRSSDIIGWIAPTSTWKLINHVQFTRSWLVGNAACDMPGAYKHKDEKGDANKRFPECHWKLQLVGNLVPTLEFFVVVFASFLLAAIPAIWHHHREKIEDDEERKHFKQQVPI